MKKIIFFTAFVLILPIAAIGIIYYFGINIFDNPDFWYGYMTFFGTVLLGSTALIQSKKANLINDRLLTMQEETARFQIKEKSSPIDINPVQSGNKVNRYFVRNSEYELLFDIDNKRYLYYIFSDYESADEYHEDYYNIVLKIKNISGNTIKEIIVEDLRISDMLYDTFTDISESGIHTYGLNMYNQILLRPEETTEICLKIATKQFDMIKESFELFFRISTMSIYNVIFSEEVTLFYDKEDNGNDCVDINIDRCTFVNMPEAE